MFSAATPCVLLVSQEIVRLPSSYHRGLCPWSGGGQT